MVADESWPFHGEQTVGRRGPLLVLAAQAPDGRPVTIVRLGPGAGPELHEEFRSAARVAGEYADARGLPPIAWHDLRTLLPWVATYDDPRHLGADLVERVLEVGPSVFGPDDLPPSAIVSTPEAAAGDLLRTAPGGTRRTPKRNRVMVSAVGGAVVLVMVLTGLAFGFAGSRSDAQPSPVRHTTVPSWTPPTAIPGVTSTGGSTHTARPRPSPTLAHREPLSVYGPTWNRRDKTATVAFPELGWAFRTARGVDCLLTGEFHKLTKVTCINLRKLGKGPRRLTIVDQTCTKPRCSRQERKYLERDLSGHKVDWKRKDKHTKYHVQTFVHDQYKKRYFRFSMSHYYRDAKHRLRRHVSVYGEAPIGRPARKIQKVINDIRTQTG
ncbi:MAG: hypothetical protein ACRDMV_08710 [Streptosporangiales bacterium]